MKFRTRLTLQFSVVVSVILITFSFIIYTLLSDFRKDEFIERLRDKGLNSVKLLADVDEVDNELLKIIDRNAVNPLPGEKVFIYDVDHKLIYCSLVIDTNEISHAVLQKIKDRKEIEFEQDSTEQIGFLFEGKYDNYLVVASAHDKFGLSKLNYLRNLLISGDIVAVGLIFLIGLFFAKEALFPLSKVLEEIDKITVSNLGLRIEVGNTKDEIGLLALKFNKMLERLDDAFATQRSFVANASHELRTPLTSLTGQLEVTLMNQEINDEGRAVLKSLLHEIRQLNRLSNGLLDLAQSNLDITEIKITSVRIDELIGLARADLLKRNKEFIIKVEFTEFPEENWLTVLANEQLLKSALSNVMENACKYSPDHTALLRLRMDDTFVHIEVMDKGIGINTEELQHVFEPFFRAKSAKKYDGHGIGLTLTRKIMEIHRGLITIESTLGAGTKIILSIPHVK
jgi:signal transduction histidine kinase